LFPHWFVISSLFVKNFHYIHNQKFCVQAPDLVSYPVKDLMNAEMDVLFKARSVDAHSIATPNK
jgi:hypothetical protein